MSDYQHGKVHWSELNTHDPEAAMKFYGDVLGWSFEAIEMDGGMTYWLIKSGDALVGGVFKMDSAEAESMPEHWETYIAVDDVDARCNTVSKNGGKILRAPMDIPQFGRMAIVEAAGGSAVCLITPSQS